MQKKIGLYERLKAHRHDGIELQSVVLETVSELKARETDVSHPGMLLGKIQSGKTRAFLGIIAHAFDEGFDVAVVLTKGTKTLAKQTVSRISGDFKEFRDDERLEVHDIMSVPQLSSWEIDHQKLIFVAKKEANNMRRLIELFTTTYPSLRSKKVLIVDDEADFASVRFTKRKDDDAIDQGRIAERIDELRRELTRSAFLQVTATPYSLYLQPDEYELQPGANYTFAPKRPAFTKLVPIHSGYVGGDHYFGQHEQDQPEYYLWHPVSEDELSALKKEDRRRVKQYEILETEKIAALRHALITFVAAGCIRRLQQVDAGERPKKFSMIVHVETSRKAHEWQHVVVAEVLQALREAADTNAAIFSQLLTASVEDLLRSVVAAGLPVPTRSEIYSEARQAFLKGAVVTEKVNTDNNVMALLDENAELKLRTPFNVFIGGQILDRGITVPNLIGFYYGRSPKKMQQDTVLQHARMYGNRPRSDLAVTRFYTTAANYTALKRIHEFDAALREAFANGAHDRGVAFIQRDASNRVIPCAPSKILASTITALRPGRAHLPIGFQTKSRTSIERTISAIDNAIPSEAMDAQSLVRVPIDTVLEVFALIETTIEMEPGYSFAWEAARSAIEYYSRIAAPEEDRGFCWLLALTGRKLARVRAGGRFNDSPHTKQQADLVPLAGGKLPIVMLFRQEGAKIDQGWRDAPFWWPVLFPPLRSAPAVFAESANEGADTKERDTEEE